MVRQVYRNPNGTIYDPNAPTQDQMGYANLSEQQLADQYNLHLVDSPINTGGGTTGGNTMNDIYGSLNFETPEERAFREAQAKAAMDLANGVIDENAIRANTLSRFQAEIDALNRVYAEKKASEQMAGQGRLGSVAAVGARRGLIGSDFGIAQERNQEQANTEAINAIENERMLQEQNIRRAALNMAQQEIADKVSAKKEGAEAYLKFIAESSTRRENNAKEIAKRLYEAGNYESTDLKSIADQLGISVDTLKATYQEYKKAGDKAKAEAESKAAEEALKEEKAMIKEGYTYVKTPAERDALKAKGYQIYEIGGKTYSKIPKTKTTTIKVGSTSYQITTDEMGNVINKTVVGVGSTPKSNTPKNNSGFNEKNAKSIVDQYIYGQEGDDGKLHPDVYNAAKAAWIEDGGTAERFDALYYKKKDPNNQYYQ